MCIRDRFISLWFCAACITTKRIKKNCDLFADVCITETETETETTKETSTETEYRDTSAIIYIPEEKVKDKIPVKIEDENKKPVPIKKEYVNSDLSILQVPFATSYAQVINSKLRHELMQTDTLLRIKLENALKEVRILNTEKWKTETENTVEIVKNSRFAKLCIRAWFVVLIIGIGYLIFKYRSKLLRLFIK